VRITLGEASTTASIGLTCAGLAGSREMISPGADARAWSQRSVRWKNRDRSRARNLCQEKLARILFPSGVFVFFGSPAAGPPSGCSL